MSAFITVSIDDGQAVPVQVDFVPSTIDPQGVARYYEANDVLDARRALSLSVRTPAKGGTVSRVLLKIAAPQMDSVDPTKKIGENIANLEFVMHKQSALDTRKDLLAFVTGALADPAVVAAVNNYQSVY